MIRLFQKRKRQILTLDGSHQNRTIKIFVPTLARCLRQEQICNLATPTDTPITPIRAFVQLCLLG